MRAKFIEKQYGTGYERDFVYLVYEYRGVRYTVYENRAKGNVPLAWQHANEQSRIDTLIELESKPRKLYKYEDTAEYALTVFLDSFN